MRLASTVALGCCLLLLPLQGASLARDVDGQVFSSMSNEQLASALTQAGLAAKVEVAKNGQQFVVFKLQSGATAVAAGGACKDQGCAIFSLWVSFEPGSADVNWANQWNQEHALIRAFVDNEGVYLQQDFILLGGVTIAHVVAQCQFFNNVVSKATSQ